MYLPKALPLTELPEEKAMFTLGMYGTGDFFVMKGVCEEFFEKAGMRGRMVYDPSDKKPWLHPGRQADMIYDGQVVGYLGEVHPEVAENYNMDTRVYVAVIDLARILPFATFEHKYTGITRFPAVVRDISLVVPHNVTAGQIEAVILQRGGKILEEVTLFDLYEGAQIRKGFKSMAYTMVFRASDRTLEEADITAAMKKIMNGLENLGIELRS